jgi:hypothetical protein
MEFPMHPIAWPRNWNEFAEQMSPQKRGVQRTDETLLLAALATDPALFPVHPSDWPSARDKLFRGAIQAGYARVFDRLVQLNADFSDPEPLRFYGALVNDAIFQAVQPGAGIGHLVMVRDTLQLSQGFEFDPYVKKPLCMTLMTARPAKDHPPGDIPLLPKVLQAVVDDGRFNDLQSQYDLWLLAGEQGQILALPVLKAWHDRLLTEAQASPHYVADVPTPTQTHPYFVAAAWDGATLKAIAGASPDCACAEAADLIRPWVTDEQLHDYFRWENNRLYQQGFWEAYDLLLSKRLEGKSSPLVPVPAHWDLGALRDMLGELALDRMPRETARRRQENAQQTSVAAGAKRPRVRS